MAYCKNDELEIMGLGFGGSSINGDCYHTEWLE